MLQIVDVRQRRLTFYLSYKKIRIPESEKWLLVESGIRKIRNPRLWNPGYSLRNRKPQLRLDPTKNPVFSTGITAWDTESKTVLGSLKWATFA